MQSVRPNPLFLWTHVPGILFLDADGASIRFLTPDHFIYLTILFSNRQHGLEEGVRILFHPLFTAESDGALALRIVVKDLGSDSKSRRAEIESKKSKASWIFSSSLLFLEKEAKKTSECVEPASTAGFAAWFHESMHDLRVLFSYPEIIESETRKKAKFHIKQNIKQTHQSLDVRIFVQFFTLSCWFSLSAFRWKRSFKLLSWGANVCEKVTLYPSTFWSEATGKRKEEHRWSLTRKVQIEERETRADGSHSSTRRGGTQ